ncbi:NUDIX hydrolase [Ferdinandcohnia sp. Marseille-Q9671]
MIRHAVGAIVYKEDSYLLVHKTKIHTRAGQERIAGEWDIVKGGCEAYDSSLHVTILRELTEETGSSQYKIIEQFDEKICFEFPTEIQKKIGFERQETTVFLVEFLGDVHALTPRDEEISDIQFVTKEQAIQTLTHDDTRMFFMKKLSQQSTK